MRTRITLVYFKGCPNVEKARSTLREFLADPAIGDKTWDEVDTLDPQSAAELRGFPSPTVLVNGFDVVTGRKTAEGRGACRLAGAPDLETLRKGFLKYGKGAAH